MSIVELAKVTVLGLAARKAETIAELQELGCMHLIPLDDAGLAQPAAGPSRQSREALHFLASCTYQRRQVTDPARFDPVAVESMALQLQKHLFELQERRDFLAGRLENLAPWGDFSFAPLDEMGGQRLWFYVVPQHEIEAFETIDADWEIVNSDHRFHYVIVVSSEEPTDMPVERTLTGARSPAELASELEEVEMAIEDQEAQRAALTRWCTLFARSLDGLEDHAAQQIAAGQTFDLDPLFALQGWVPTARVAELERHAQEHDIALEVMPPDDEDDPPTLFENPPPLRAGEDLVTFYRTPGYRLWDPSSVVFYSFALFFAMIIADAGYGLVIGGITAWLWKRLAATEAGAAWRVLLTFLSVVTSAYGVLVGSYFGVSPPPGSLLAGLAQIDIHDAPAMMALSIGIGGAHVMLANAMDAYRQRGSPAALAPLGWLLVIGGGLLLGSQLISEGLPLWPGQVSMVLGLGLVVLFSGYGASPLARIGQGAMALTRLTKAFGDVLSYLRLFALGLASASLAAAFNDMAAGAREALSGLGLLAALLILALGHGLNFVLAIASAVIHGLRLNFIEFFDWGVPDEGRLFRAFERKNRNS